MGQIVLIIMDGWGLTDKKNGNAIKLAKTPIMDRISKTYPTSKLKAAGESVGLPKGQMGNSEVGHLNLGGGRIVQQPLVRINNSIKDKGFFHNTAFLESFKNIKKYDSRLHLIGLLSDGGVHSQINHLFAILDMAKKNNLLKICVHAVLDGRDTSPISGVNYIRELENKLKEIGSGKIVSVMGRYYAMDRDKRWDRVKKAYDTIVCGIGNKSDNATNAVKKSYKNGVTDEFVIPLSIVKENKYDIKKSGEKIIDKNSDNLVKENDSIIFFNFREDRARELSHALTDKEFNFFNRCNFPKIHFTSMMEYEKNIKACVAFPPMTLTKNLGEILCKNGLNQLRIAETEKYAHVTFFFNGGREEPYEGEKRILIPSPKVATYDLQPEMCAYEVTEVVIKEIQSKKHDVIIMNYANGDMVGHTGMMEPVVKAIETVDKCLGKVIQAVQKIDGTVIITADHGNAELMLGGIENEVVTAHSSNPVPFILITNDKKIKVRDGILADVSPTILELLGIEKPKEMTGESLILK